MDFTKLWKQTMEPEQGSEIKHEIPRKAWELVRLAIFI
jgi:hypothetical protein